MTTPEKGTRADDLLGRAGRLELRTRHLVRSRFAGLYRSAFRGQGMEFSEVREYVDGDDVRLIDWNVSARTQSLHIKRMMEERDRNVLVLLDTSASLAFGSIGRTKFDLLVEVAAIFVLAGYSARDKVSLALAQDRVDRYIPPSKGWNHAVRLVREMAACRPAGGATTLEPVWDFLNAPGVHRSLVVLLTDFQAPFAPGNRFAVTCRKHELLVVLAGDPRDRTLPDVGRIRLRHPETGESCVIDTSRPEVRSGYERSANERWAEVCRLLRNNRADWIELSTASDPCAPLRRYMELRSLRMGYRRL
jgi:uncharacterized protein (DUF58 family)